MAASSHLSPVIAVPADNSIPDTKPLTMTTASWARPRTASRICAGSPGTPTDGSATNFGVPGSFAISLVADVSGSDEVG